MKFAKALKDLIKSVDFFYSNQMFRYQDELQYKTFTGGFLTLGIIATICVAFFSMVLQTLHRNVFTTSLQISKSANPQLATLSTNADSHFMFGVQIQGLNLSDTRRHFDVKMNSYTDNQSTIELETCTEKHWQKFPKILAIHTVGNWLCPPINLDLKLQGKQNSDIFYRHDIRVTFCSNATSAFNNSTCRSKQEIEDYFHSYQNMARFTVFYSTPIINQAEKDYKSYYVEDLSYTFFGPNLGSQIYLYFTDYTVKTDESILPFENLKQESGILVESIPTKYPFQTELEGRFVAFHFLKSTNSLVYKREAQKLTTVFSFMGGNIAALSGVLFIIKMYTQFAFSINLAYNLFKRQEQQNNQKENHQQISINFLLFFKFAIYKLLKFAGKAKTDWQEAKYIQRCQKQIDKQLDINCLLKRLIFVQFCITYMFEDYQLEGLQLKKPKTSDQIKKTREKCLSVVDNDEVQSVIKESKRQIEHQPQQRLKELKGDIKYRIQDRIVEMKDQINKQHLSPQRFFGSASRKQEMMVVESIAGQKEEQSSSNLNNKVMDICFGLQKKRQLLNKLKNNAKKGDRLSVKIWKALQQNEDKACSIKQE